MIHYRDRTFCASPCATRECPRHKDNVPADTNGLPVLWGHFRATCADCRRERNSSMTAHRYSIGHVIHYKCARCHGWWTIGDGPTTGQIYCPWCGVLHTLKDINE